MTTKTASNFRTTYILMGAVAVLLAGLGIYIFFVADKNPNREGFLLESFHALQIEPEKLTGLEIDKGGEKFVFARMSDGRWRMMEPVEARADSGRVHAIAQQLLNAKRVDKGANITENLAVHGLDNPAVKVTLRKGDRSSTLALGKTTTGGALAVIYVLTSDDPKKPQAVRRNDLSALFQPKPPEGAGTAEALATLDDFRTRKLLGEGIEPSAAANFVHSIKLTLNRGKGPPKVVALSRKNEEKVWRFEIPPDFGEAEMSPPERQFDPATISYLPQLLSNVLAIEVPDVKDYLTGERDLAALGLDPSSPGLLRIDLDDALGNETLWIATDQSKSEAKKERDKVYVRYEGDTSVAQVNGEKARLLLRFINNPSTIRDTTLVKLDPKRIDAVAVTLRDGGQTFELQKGEGERWKVFADGTAADANPERVRALIARLTEPRLIRSFPPAETTDAQLGVDKPAVEVRLWQDGIAASEKADAAGQYTLRATPSARVQFGNPDVGDLVFARRYRGLTKVDAAVAKAVMQLAGRKRLEYVDAYLPSFDPAKVEAATLPHGGETFVVQRVEKDERLPEAAHWKIVAPPARAGKFADPQKMQLILDSLREIRPLRVEAEKPTAEQLAALGLDPARPPATVTHPTVKVVLTIAGEGERTYVFGNSSANPLNVYAKVSNSDYVIEVPAGKPDLIAQGQLLDPLLYRVDRANVKGLTLRGWIDSSATGAPQELELERRSGAWSAKGNFAVDGAKAEALLAAVAAPRAEATLVEKAGPKPEHGLDVNKGALEITILPLEGPPVTLTLGTVLAKDTGLVVAATNQANGDVFSLKAPLLLAVKEKPAALKRSDEKK